MSSQAESIPKVWDVPPKVTMKFGSVNKMLQLSHRKKKRGPLLSNEILVIKIGISL